MRRVSIDCLVPGMVVARTLYDSNGTVLLGRGVALTDYILNKLIEKNVPFLYIDDSLTKNAVVIDVLSERTRNEANKVIKENLIKIGQNINGDINFQQIEKVVMSIIGNVVKNPNLVFEMLDIVSVGDYLYSHSINVCVLSLMTGISMGYNREQLNELAIGAFLHDIGKVMVPIHILSKPNGLNQEEFAEIKKHPVYTKEILAKNRYITPVSQKIAYQHHERYNGEGYPLGLKREEISDMAQIIGIADIYSAMSAEKVYKKALPAKEICEYIAASGDYHFKYDIIKHFLSQVAIYGVGCIVQLSSGQIAVVKQNFKGIPLMPKVQIILDRDGTVPKNLYLYLDKVKNVVIDRELTEAEIKKVKEYVKAG